MQQSFIFGGNTPMTYEQLQKQREIADALIMSNMSTPRNVGEGLNAVGKALAFRSMKKKADKRDTELKGEYDAAKAAALGGYGGGSPGMAPAQGGYTGPSGPPLPPPDPNSPHALGDAAMAALGKPAVKTAADPASIKAGLVARGLPEHIAEGFVMNFQDESGMNPGINEANPVVPGSRGGFGLYQLTGPRRKAYEAYATERGIPLDDVDAQLDFLMMELQGPEAAAWAKISGAQNAGEAGAAIVNNFLRPAEEHRNARASEYLGAGGMPAQGGAGGMDLGTLSTLAASPYATAGEKAVYEALIGQQTKAMDPMYNLDLQKAQLELEQMQNPTAKPGFTQLTAQEVQQLGLPPGVYQRGPDGRIDTIEKTQGPADPIADLKARAAAAGLQEGTPEFQQFMLNNGKAPEGMVIESDGQGGFRMVQGAGAGSAASKPFTEGQSKDVVYATRAEGALAALDPIAESLTGRMDVAKGYVPFGLGAESQNPDYQVAKTAGDEFLQAILRKDTGEAITADEQALYGETYLPRPGDGPDRLAYKSQARKRAVEALKAGMTPAAIVAQERALQRGGSPAKADGASLDFSKMSIAEVGQVDISSLTPEQMDALEARMTELGL